MCKRPLIKFRSLKRSRTGVWANWALSVQCTRRAGRSRWRLMDAQSFLRKTDRCVTHATFVQWDRGKDGPSESRDSPRARATARLPRLLPAPPTPTWGTFMTSATATTTTTASTERPACRPEGWEGVRTGRVRAIVRFRSLERAVGNARVKSHDS